MDTILYPLMVPVAWIMVQFHSLLTALGLSASSGAAWALSIVGLVVVIRIALIPLFVKQIKASRGMQMLSPELQAIQKKYKGKTDPASREAMSRETMELYRKHGTNPFSSCLPILAQSPIFFALFTVLNNLKSLAEGTYARDSIGPLTQELAIQANDATLFGAPISSSFLSPDASTATRIVTVVLIVAMSVTTFTTQRQLTQKNMPASALQGPMAQQQKMLLYVLPLVFAFSGVNFPIGVLIYWTTTNLWSMGQQFYVIRRNPTPGSEAERALKARRAKKAAAKGIVLEEEAPVVEEKPRGQRSQPKRKERDRRPAGAAPAASEDDAAADSGASEQTRAAGTTAPAPRKPAGTTGARTGGTRPKAGTTPTQRSGSRKGTGAAGLTQAPTPRSGASTKPATEAKGHPGTGAAGKVVPVPGEDEASVEGSTAADPAPTPADATPAASATVTDGAAAPRAPRAARPPRTAKAPTDAPAGAVDGDGAVGGPTDGTPPRKPRTPRTPKS